MRQGLESLDLSQGLFGSVATLPRPCVLLCWLNRGFWSFYESPSLIPSFHHILGPEGHGRAPK